MPPTGRRRARNKDAEQLRSEADTPEVTTPSRKRRRINGADNKPAAVPATSSRSVRRASAESDETIENQYGDENDLEEQNAYALAEEVIRHLRVAQYEVGVAIDHNNSVVEQSAQAFAKIAGRTWTYYVSSLSVIIGRPNVKAKRESPGNLAHDPINDDMKIDIDLGPDQQVSRIHAQIQYDSDREQWFIIVNGRNGLTVDEQRLDRGDKMYLHSGTVIGVLGTQMMFMLPTEAPVVHPAIRKALLLEEDDVDEGDVQGDPQARSFNRGPRGRASNAYQASSQPRSAPPQNSTRAAQALASLSTSQQPPGTPAPRSKEQPQPKSKPSPAYSRGLLLESTEEIDYSADSAKDIKPPHSYAQMIGQAILSTPEENATLARIYEFIKEKYAFFRFGGGGWQNSIRHNLSLSKHFEKIPRRTDEPGKGMKWQIVPEHRAEYMKKNFHDNRRAPRRVGSSGPNSPAANMGPSAAQTERLLGALNEPRVDTNKLKGSPRSVTPPLVSFPAPNESYTPDRGPRPANLQTTNLPNGVGGPISANSETYTPTFDRSSGIGRQHGLSNTGPTATNRGGLNEASIDSPPALSATGYDTNNVANLFTPLPARQAPRPTLLSTVKPPSFYAKELFSSPAPFWKYVDLGSTPNKPHVFDDVSPAKKEKQEPEDEDDEETDDDEVEDVKANIKKDEELEDPEEPDLPQPSSPPRAPGDGLDESPSRTISRPVSRREGPGPRSLEPIPSFAPPAQPNFGLNSSLSGPAFKLYAGDVNVDDEEEEKGIDLAKGFQKIGSFHRSMQATSSVSH